MTTHQAIVVARRYAGRQWNAREPIAAAFGRLRSLRYHGPAWFVTDPDASVPSTGPNPQRTRAWSAFVPRRSLTVVVDARTGQPIEAFAPAGVYHGL